MILRPTDWRDAPFSILQALPENAKPVTSWSNRDEALFSVVGGIRESIKKLTPAASPHAPHDEVGAIQTQKHPNSLQAPTAYPNIAGHYKGTAYNKVANAYIAITFSFEQIQGQIRGRLQILTPGVIGSGPFVGTIDTKGQLKLNVQGENGQSTLLVEGTLYPDQSIGGVYTMTGYLDMGLWHIKPV